MTKIKSRIHNGNSSQITQYLLLELRGSDNPKSIDCYRVPCGIYLSIDAVVNVKVAHIWY